MIDYKISKSTQKDLFLHLEKCDLHFVPPLSDKVNLRDYSKKIAEYAVTFEAWNQTELVGVVAAYFNNETGIVFITNVSVIETFANKSIAGELIGMAQAYSLERDFERLSLEVDVQNKKAIAFYIKHGFETKHLKDDSIFMELNIEKS